MAGRSQHVHDSSVAERRLRPIYEWLDGGDNKKALQEADKVLRKTPNLRCARALKALALLRLGREPECITLLDGLNSEKPSDDPTLQAMTICYRELHLFDKVCKLYETAIEQDPKNEELHTHLFMSYVRVLDFKSQQQSAMALYKLKPKNPYYFWAVMSVVLQAIRGHVTDEGKKKLLLSLAERMVDRLMDDNKIEAEQEVQLYLMILKLQNKNEEALKLLESPLGSRLLTAATTHAKIPFLINLKQWSQLNVLCKKLLIESIDLWDVWLHYLDSVFKLFEASKCIQNNSNNGHENNINDDLTADDSIEKCHEFICSLIESCSITGPVVRSPWLVRLELYVRLQKRNLDPNSLLGDFLELLVEYFRKFGNKPCCVFDMKMYIKWLPFERRSELSSRLLKDVGFSSRTLPQSEKQMQQHINSLQLARLCGAHQNLNVESLNEFVTALVVHYQHGISTYGDGLLPTELNPSDPYALLCAHVLYDLSQKEQSSTPIILALTLLENLLKTSPSNHHAKLLCIKLYHWLGAGLAAHQAYETLDVKHVQLDSMGHVHCGQLPVSGPLSIASQLFTTTSNFFSINYKDTADHLTLSYKFGSFLKLEEFLDFRERLNNSSLRSIVATDKALLELLQCNNIQALNFKELCLQSHIENYDGLRDNRDVTIYVNYDPETIENSPEQLNSAIFEQDKQVLRIRNALLCCVLIALELSLSKDDSKKLSLEKLISSQKTYLDVCESVEQSNYEALKMDHLTACFPSRLHQQLNAPYRKVIGTFLDILKGLAIPDITVSNIAIENSTKYFIEMIQDICNKIRDQKNEKDIHWSKRKTVENVLNVVEIVSLSTLLCAACCELSKPVQGKKGKKKGSSNTPTSATWSNILNLLSTMKDNIEIFSKTLQVWWNPTDDEISLAERLNSLSVGEGSEKSVLMKLNTSHITLVKEIHALLKEKQKYITMLSS